MNSSRKAWRWTEREVDQTGEHIEIRFGGAKDAGWDQCTRVALVSPPKRGIFAVKFLIAGREQRERDMLQAVRRELDFYLVEKGEKNPWAYARYHCGTCANVYSMVNWSFFAKGSKAQQAAAADD